MNTLSMAAYGGVPAPLFGLTVFVPTDSTEESCWIITVSGYRDVWASPPIVLSGGIGWNVKPFEEVVLRPTFGIGDGGLAPNYQFYSVFTVHLGLWAEYKLSHRISLIANYEKRFDITYRFWSPWGLSVGVKFNLEHLPGKSILEEY
jgi:hypothetical protein